MVFRCVKCDRVLRVTVLSEQQFGEIEPDQPIQVGGRPCRIKAEAGICPRCAAVLLESIGGLVGISFVTDRHVPSPEARA